MLTNIIRLWRSAQSCRRDEEKPLRVLGFSDLSGHPILILPSSQIFEHVEDFIFIHIMSEPVLEKSKSTLSKGTSSCPADVGGVQGTFESFRLAKRDEL